MEKAALSLAAAAVSPIITKLGEKVVSYFGGDISHEELSHLQTNILPKIQTVINQAERIDAPTTLKPWLMKLQADAYEAEDILDMYQYNIIKNQVSPLPTCLKKIKGKAKEFFAPVSLKTKLKRSFEKLKQSADDANEFIHLLNLVNSTTAPIQEANTMRRQQQRTTVSGLTSTVFGRDEELNAVVNMLITDGDESSSNSKRNVTLHAIHGMGGAGKTTLAQYVCQDPRVEDHFDLKIWIHVSRTFDPYRITKQIIEAVGSSSPVGNLDALQKKLKEVLKSKRFLVVLDDVWTEDRQLWDQLLIPLYEGGEVGSRILVTTRMERTVLISRVKGENILSLEDLKIEECRSIFKYYAFDDAGKVIEDQELSDIFEKILRKLKNSPLAARLAGCLLSNYACDIDAWRRILNSDLLGETLDVILLSFQHLPPHLQCCFAICSLYPKGYRYNSSDIDELIRLWIAHGYVEATDNESLEDKGKQYFDDLLSYSLFQSDPTIEGKYVMHDLVHDLAETVSKGYCFRIEGDDPLNIPPTVIHLSIVDGKFDLHIAKILELVNLRTFVIFWSSSDMSSSDISKHLMTMFEKITKLRVLRFEWPPVLELNTSVGKLKHLRDLELIDTKKLPESLGTLYHLQFLCLYDSQIKEVPKSLENLVRLRCLLLPDDVYSKIENVGKLTFLQELKVYYANKKYGLQQLKNLQQIRGSLTIEGLENVKDMKGAAIAMLNEKRHLDELTLRWDNNNGGDDVDNDKDQHVLEGLKPNPNLKKLEICGYKGAKSASWIGMVNNQDWLRNLTSLELSSCPNLIGVSNLPGHLKELTVKECPKLMQLAPYPCSLEALEVVGDCPAINALLSSATSSSESFCLKSLKIEGVSIVDEEILNGFLTNNWFNSLSELEFVNLPSITSLQLGPHLTALKELFIVGLEDLRSVKFMGSATSLEKLTVEKCPKLTTFTGAEGGKGIAAGNLLLSSEGFLEIDEPLLLPILLQEQSLNSLVILFIQHSSQDVPFNADQEGIFLRLTSLKDLSFENCRNLPSLPMALENLSSLKSLDISGCSNIESLPNMPSSLESLLIFGCSNIESLPNMPSSLESLEIYSCSNIESLPNMPSSMKLLLIVNCHPQLEANYKEGGPLRNEISHIPKIIICYN